MARVDVVMDRYFKRIGLAAATLTGFIAEKNVVATFAIILAASDQSLNSVGGSLTEFFTPVTVFAFLLFLRL